MARALGFTRARITQLVDLLLIAPAVLEEILFLELPLWRPAGERARPARASVPVGRLARAAAGVGGLKASFEATPGAAHR